MQNNLQQMHLKLLHKETIQKTVEASGDLIGNRIANKIKKIRNKLIQKQSQTSTIRNYLKKDTYLQKRGK